MSWPVLTVSFFLLWTMVTVSIDCLLVVFLSCVQMLDIPVSFVGQLFQTLTLYPVLRNHCNNNQCIWIIKHCHTVKGKLVCSGLGSRGQKHVWK